MKVLSAILSLCTFLASASATAVRYDEIYDDPEGSFTSVSCSNGANGLITRYNFTNFASAKAFPRIGAVAGVTWNSPDCGKCHKLTFNPGNGQPPKFTTVLAVDWAQTGFVVSKAALNELTGGHAIEYGVVDASVMPAQPAACGL